MDQRPPEPVPGRQPRDLDVPVVPVRAGSGRDGRRSRAPLVAAAALVAVVAAGVALAQLFPADPARLSLVDPSPVVAATNHPTTTAYAPATPAPVVVAQAPARLRAADLVAGVLDGSLDGWLVYADAELVATCERTTPGCVPAPAVSGLALPVTGSLDEVAGGGPPDASVLVLRVDGDHLAYLGSLVVHVDGSPSLERLTGELVSVAPPAPTLFDARGWLIIHPPCIVAAPNATCPPAEAFLADDEPMPDGIVRSDRGERVAIAPDVWGIDATSEVLRAGPFLVRPVADGGLRWEIVARYDPSRSVRVVIP